MDATDAALLIVGGLIAGVVNTLAGGGSLLTVPLLVLMGLPGSVANGTNRVGILAQSIVASWRFRAEGVGAARDAIPVLIPLALGSALGALAISKVPDEIFERLFGALMLLLLFPTLWPRKREPEERVRQWSRARSFAVFGGIGIYAGAIQVGTGIALLFTLNYAGFGLVRSNAIKMIIMIAVTAAALPAFLAAGQIAWAPALVLAVGFSAGGALGARIAVSGGTRVIRPVVAVAVIGLAGRMLGLY